MTWLLPSALVAWLIGVPFVYWLAESLVGESRAGRAALKPVALAWPVLSILLLAIGLVALFGGMIDVAIDKTLGRVGER